MVGKLQRESTSSLFRGEKNYNAVGPTFIKLAMKIDFYRGGGHTTATTSVAVEGPPTQEVTGSIFASGQMFVLLICRYLFVKGAQDLSHLSSF